MTVVIATSLLSDTAIVVTGLQPRVIVSVTVGVLVAVTVVLCVEVIVEVTLLVTVVVND